MGSILYYGIRELVSLQGAHRKKGRRIFEGDLSVISDGAILVQGRKIKKIGSRNEFKGLKGVKKVNLKAECVLPGFIDCHTHFAFGGDRADEFELRNQGVSYSEIAKRGGGIVSTVKATRGTSKKDLLKKAQYHANEFLKQGVTTLEGKTGYGLDHETELRCLEVMKKVKGPKIVTTFLGPHAIPKEFSSASDYMTEVVLPLLKKVATQKLSTRADIFLEKGCFDIEQCRLYLTEAKKLGFDLTLHTDQLTPSGAILELLKFSPMSLDHLVCISDDEIKAIAKSDVTAVLLPTSDFYIKIPYPKARALLDAGARVAVSTDFNPGSSPSWDISFLGVLSRLNMGMTLPEVLSGLTVSPAHALGLQDELGALETAHFADFVSFSCSYKELFYQVGKHPVTSVYKSGQRIC